jgi:hypothetical protein
MNAARSSTDRRAADAAVRYAVMLCVGESLVSAIGVFSREAGDRSRERAGACARTRRIPTATTPHTTSASRAGGAPFPPTRGLGSSPTSPSGHQRCASTRARRWSTPPTVKCSSRSTDAPGGPVVGRAPPADLPDTGFVVVDTDTGDVASIWAPAHRWRLEDRHQQHVERVWRGDAPDAQL